MCRQLDDAVAQEDYSRAQQLKQQTDVSAPHKHIPYLWDFQRKQDHVHSYYQITLPDFNHLCSALKCCSSAGVA